MTTATYRTDGAADPELYERLMRERYGPLPKLLAELVRPRPEPPVRRRTKMPALSPTIYEPNPDPKADEHYADLAAGIEEAGIGRPRPARSAEPERIPPFPGATWCKSCDSWCTSQGVCRCNNR
ncbi:hypothetical protein [Streptomyces sp. NPDC005181]|uniref:hypothetical protein n=1 Tax=Streptomyces sp. NPDC005181 TaxID=3156869 RepID=UPI0033B02ADC